MPISLYRLQESTLGLPLRTQSFLYEKAKPKSVTQNKGLGGKQQATGSTLLTPKQWPPKGWEMIVLFAICYIACPTNKSEQMPKCPRRGPLIRGQPGTRPDARHRPLIGDPENMGQTLAVPESYLHRFPRGGLHDKLADGFTRSRSLSIQHI